MSGWLWGLIVTSFLAICLGVSTYVMYDQVERHQMVAARSAENERSHRARQQEAERKLDEIRQLVFSAAPGSFDELMAAARSTLANTQRLGPTRSQDKQRFETVVDEVSYLCAELRTVDQRYAELNRKITELRTELAGSEAAYQTQVNQSKEYLRETETEASTELAKLDAFIDTRQTKIGEMTKRFGDKNEELEQVRRDRQTVEKNLNEQIKGRRLQIEDLTRQEVVRGQLQFELPDGEISFPVNAGSEAQINLGSRHNIFPGLTFSVYPRATGGNPYRWPKAYAEVIRVLSPDTSLVRLLDRTNTNPVLAGDLLYNPIWSTDGTARIAHVGIIAVNDINEGDKEIVNRFVAQQVEFERLVEKYGGKIDAKVNLRTGQIEGQLSPDTTWLVIGYLPESSASDDDPTLAGEWNWIERKFGGKVPDRLFSLLNSGASQMRRSAQDNGVRAMDARNFMVFMGHNPPVRRVAAGTEYDLLFRPDRLELAPEPGLPRRTSRLQYRLPVSTGY